MPGAAAWSEASIRLAFPTGCADVWRVLLSEPAEATSVASVPPA
jgi:hypothetical protein